MKTTKKKQQRGKTRTKPRWFVDPNEWILIARSKKKYFHTMTAQRLRAKCNVRCDIHTHGCVQCMLALKVACCVWRTMQYTQHMQLFYSVTLKISYIFVCRVSLSPSLSLPHSLYISIRSRFVAVYCTFFLSPFCSLYFCAQCILRASTHGWRYPPANNYICIRLVMTCSI